MKKIVFLSMILAVLVTSCKKDDSKTTTLNYKDSDPIKMVFQDTHKIKVSSDYDITYEILNTDTIPVLKFEGKGVLKALNMGTDKVRISNGYETKTVDVVVDLFTEPPFEFGCTPNRIKELFGEPTYFTTTPTNSYLYYEYIGTDPATNYMYSPTCYHMDFYFKDCVNYEQAELYIRKANIVFSLNKYLRNNFDFLFQYPNFYYDSILTHDSVPADIYQNKLNPSIVCFKYEHANQYDDYGLVYRELDIDSLANSLKTRPRSSKFLY